MSDEPTATAATPDYMSGDGKYLVPVGEWCPHGGGHFLTAETRQTCGSKAFPVYAKCDKELVRPIRAVVEGWWS